MERHSDWCAAGDGRVVGSDDIRVSGAKGARWLCGDHILGVLEADSEENVTVPVFPADAVRRVERVDLQLEHSRRQDLRREQVCHTSEAMCVRGG